MTTSRQWASHVRAWRSSEQTAASYCKEQGLGIPAFRYWSSGRKREEVERLNGEARSGEVRLARVRLRSPTAEVVSAAPMRLVVGSVGLEVPTGFDRAALKDVLEVLVAVTGGAR